jgi:heat shock protein HslJ
VKVSIALLLTLLVLAGCSVASAPMSPSASAPGSLDGRTFVSTMVTGHDLVPKTTVRLSFKDGRLGANAGCNQIGGAYTIATDRLTLDSMMSTEMGCDPALMAQDGWLSTFLTGASVAIAGNTLTLVNVGVTMNLTDRRVADSDRSLVGTHWVVDGIVAGDASQACPLASRHRSPSSRTRSPCSRAATRVAAR